MQKVRRHPFGLRPLVSVWFQVLLTQLIAVLFTFQSPYFFTIGHQVVFSLARWAGRIRTEFHELRATLERLSKETNRFRLRAFHPLWDNIPEDFDYQRFCNSSKRPQPQSEDWFGLFRFRSPLLTE